MTTNAEQRDRVHRVLLDALRAVDQVCRDLEIDYWLDGGTLLGAIRYGGPIPWDDDVDLCMLRADFERFVAAARERLGPTYTLLTPAEDPYVAVSGKVFVNGTHIVDRYAKRYGLPGTSHDGLFVDVMVLDPISRFGPVRNVERKRSGLVGARAWARDMARSPNITSRLRRMRWTIAATLPHPISASLERILLRRATRRRSHLIGPRAEGLHLPRNFRRADIFPLIDISFGDVVARGPRDPHAYLRTQYGADYMTPPPEPQRRWHSDVVRFDESTAS
jgi:lipopolysaccharide cholinephosphotransferase